MQQDNIQKKINGLWIMFAVLIVLTVAFGLASGLLSSKNIQMPTMLSLLAGEGTIVIPALIYVLKNNYSFTEDLGFKKIKIGTFFITILLGFFVIPIASFVNILSQFFVSNTMVQASDALLEGSTGVMILVTGVLAPICEEFTFRGVFNNCFGKYTTAIKAVLVSSLMFGLMHLNINQMCYAIVLGLIFGIVNKASGSVCTSMIIHIVVNTVNMLMLAVTSMAYEEMDMNLADSVEEVRQSKDFLFVTAGVYLVLAIIFGTLSILCIVFIAKHEGRFDEFKAMFVKKVNTGDINAESAEENVKAKVILTVPAIVAILLCIFIIFGYGPLLKAIGWM